MVGCWSSAALGDDSLAAWDEVEGFASCIRGEIQE